MRVRGGSVVVCARKLEARGSQGTNSRKRTPKANKKNVGKTVFRAARSGNQSAKKGNDGRASSPGLWISNWSYGALLGFAQRLIAGIQGTCADKQPGEWDGAGFCLDLLTAFGGSLRAHIWFTEDARCAADVMWQVQWGGQYRQGR